ncbi:ankyrin repeat-containing domain protein [Pelagophyceae sp. CCMP2097]|nr:ankyrin repeat-containing domain protein [Pelagophyceae sp. CCMP2097]
MRLLLAMAMAAGSCAGVALAPCAQMFAATYDGNVALVEDLLARGCDTHLRDADGLTPLMIAAKRGHAGVVGVLLDHSVAVDQVTADRSTPLIIPAAYGHVDVLGTLLRAGAAVRKTTDSGFTSLMIAAQNGHVGAVGLLLDHGAVVDQVTADGRPPLVLAAAYGHAGVVDLLIATGANVNDEAADGVTPLYVSARNGRSDVVEVLIKSGAELDTGLGLDQATPLFFASLNGHRDVVEMFIESGADVNKATAGGLTPLCAAALQDHAAVVEMLIESGANVDKPAVDGATPLCSAALNGHSDIVKMLIESGADLNRLTHNGETPAFTAARYGHAAAFDMLLGALGCDANRATRSGWTAAHAAAFGGHLAVLTSLLRAGCDVSTVKTMIGETPLQLALMHDQMAAVELLDTASPMRGRAIALFSLVVAADAAYLDLVRDAGADQAVRRNGAPSKPRSTTTKRRREKTKPGSSRTLSNEPPADDTDEAAMHIDESSQAGDAASFSVDEVKTETCDDEHARLVEAPPPPDDFDDATTVALLESLGLGSLLAVFREHEIDDSALLYLEPGDMRDMDIPLASALKILSAVRSCHKSQQLLSAQAVLDGATQHQAVLEAELHEHRAELARLKVAQRDVDEDMMCPISSELMKDPVISRDGNTYERVCIEQWFATGASTSPLTNEALSSLDVVPNIFARKKIAEFLDKCRRAPAFR